MQTRGYLFFGMLAILLLSISSVSVAADTSSTNPPSTAGSKLNFQSEMYKKDAAQYTEEFLINMGQYIANDKNVDNINARAAVVKRCSSPVKSCADWMDADSCAAYKVNAEEDHKADCDSVMLDNAAKQAYENSLKSGPASVSTDTTSPSNSGSTDINPTDTSNPSDSASKDASSPSDSDLTPPFVNPSLFDRLGKNISKAFSQLIFWVEKNIL